MGIFSKWRQANDLSTDPASSLSDPPSSEALDAAANDDDDAADDDSADATSTQPAGTPAWADTLASSVAQTNESVRALADAQRAPAQRQAPQEETEVDLKTINRMIADGDGDVADVIDRAVNQRLNKALASRVGPLEDRGMRAISALTRETLKAKMPLYGKDKAITKDFDAEIAKLPEQYHIEPEVHMALYERVVGRHFDRLVTDARTREQKRGDLDEGTPLTGRRSQRADRMRGEDEDAVPTPMELGGTEALRALRFVNRDPDRFAQAQGYKSWNHYMTEAASRGFFGPTDEAQE